MRKRLIWLIIGCLCVGLVSYGAFGLADRPVSAEISKETKGQFVRLDDGGKQLVMNVSGQEASYPVSATVWVYRNMQKSALTDMKPGDSVDMILNSKDQAAYIKATSAQEASQSGQESKGSAAEGDSTNSTGLGASGSTGTGNEAGTPSPTTPETAATVTPPAATPGLSGSSSSTSGSPKPTPGNVTSGAGGSAPPSKVWEKLDLEWKSREFELRVKQEPGKEDSKEKGKSEIFLQSKDRSIIHLDGAEADSFIQQLVKGLPSDSKAFEASLKQKIASEFQLKNTSPEWKLDVKWPEKSASVARPQEAKVKGYEKDKEQDKQKDHGNGKGKEKEKDKEKHQDKGRSDNNNDD
ncbi:hypothetical protein [Paenibacillus sp. RC67]|uniref:hypothetical protein n=1 Tax=Paenibacillus sp. RC67 TaxID=3039392 RepID=UPI0024AE6483|nr:hypothetical protein [Paenibacillus sp. RC67]